MYIVSPHDMRETGWEIENVHVVCSL
jgi:hypothetical protein